MTRLRVARTLSEMPDVGISSDRHKTDEEARLWGESFGAEEVVVYHRKHGGSILAALVFEKDKGNGRRRKNTVDHT